MRSTSFVIVSMSAILLTVFDASAASYGDFVGSHVTYRSVQDRNGLLRSPEIVGDALAFDPLAFDLSCPGAGVCDAPALQLLDGGIFELASNPGSSLRSVTITLVGQADLDGVAGESTWVSMFSRVNVLVREVEGFGGTVSTGGADDTSYVLSSIEAGTSTDPWSASLTVDLDEIIARENLGRLPGQQISGHATRVVLDLGFALGAIAPPGASARIGFADLDGIVITAVVPEPTSACLMALGLIGLAWTSRRQGSSLDGRA